MRLALTVPADELGNEVARLVAAGATLVDHHDRGITAADPDRHEFTVTVRS